MSGFELLAAIVLFLVGYWVVSAIWPNRKQRSEPDPTSAEPWHTVLGVPPSASAEEITRAYQQLSVQFDPERGSPAERDAAIAQTRKINDAYAEAMSAKRIVR